MTAHVSACPNHQVGRVTPFRTRGLVAMSASFGYELNPLELSEEERRQIAEQTARYHALGSLITDGDFYRLVSPFETNSCAWMFVSPDKSRAVATYHIDELDADFGGGELMFAGLGIPVLKDFEALSFTLTRV